MDIKCKNCGQMITETDKFCKYCGYLLPEKEVLLPKTKQKVEDDIQEAKATITVEELADASLFDTSNVTIKIIGDKKSIYTKSVVLTGASMLITAGLFVAAFFIKYSDMSQFLAFMLMLISALSVMSFFGLCTERYLNTKAIMQLTDSSITVRRYGFSKPAEFLLGGNVCVLDIKTPCSTCKGSVTGDLHIERLERVLVAVCNINRKHYWIIDEDIIISGVKDGSIKTVTIKQDRADKKLAKIEKKTKDRLLK